jgi:hypothetical protein
MNTPNPPKSLALARDERQIMDALRIARASTVRPARDSYVQQLATDMLTKGRLTGVRQILAILRDAFDRGAPESELLAVPDELTAIIARWHEEKRGMLPIDLASAHLDEEVAEGAKDCAETILAHQPSPGAAQRFLRATAAYDVADNKLVECARRIRDRCFA